MQPRTGPVYLLVVVALGLVVVLAGTTLAQSSNPTNIGTWKLNPAKSTYSAGTAPRSATFTNEAAGAGVKTVVDMLSAAGTVRHWYYIANYDGKDSPIVGDSIYADVTVALTRVDADTTRSIFKKRGTVMFSQTSVVSSDGKTITISTKATNALEMTVNSASLIRSSTTFGYDSNSVAVYDKQ